MTKATTNRLSIYRDKVYTATETKDWQEALRLVQVGHEVARNLQSLTEDEVEDWLWLYETEFRIHRYHLQQSDPIQLKCVEHWIEVAERLSSQGFWSAMWSLANGERSRFYLYHAQRQYQFALQSITRAIVLTELRTELNKMGEDLPVGLLNDLAMLYYNRGILLRELSESEAALKDYDAAILIREEQRDYYHQSAEAWPAEYRNDLSMVYNNRGILLTALSKPEAALKDYDAAILIREELRDYYHQSAEAWPAEYRNNLARVYNNRGNLLDALSKPEAALKDYDAAILILEELRDYYHQMAEAWPAEYRNNLANVYNNRGSLLKESSKFETALKDYDAAILIGEELRDYYHQSAETWPTKYRNDLAMFYNNRGNLLDALSESEAALKDYDAAILVGEELRDYYHQSAEAWPAEYQNDLSMVYYNRSALYWGHSDRSDAWADWQAANYYLNGLPLGPSIDFIRLRFQIAHHGILLLDRQPAGWAEQQSRALVHIIETYSPSSSSLNFLAWHPVYRLFRTFHSVWLGACVQDRDYAVLLRILSIMQGREITARFEEELVKRDNVSSAVVNFLQARDRLRQNSQELALARYALTQGRAFKYEGLEDSSETDPLDSINNDTPRFLDDPDAIKVRDRAVITQTIHQLEQQEIQLRKLVNESREQAAQIPNYQDLATAYHPVNYEQICDALGHTGSGSHEAAVLLFDIHREKTVSMEYVEGTRHTQVSQLYHYALICAPGQSPQLIPLGALNEVASAIRRFNLWGRQSTNSGSVRNFIGDRREPTTVLPDNFWTIQLDQLTTALWQPLAHLWQAYDHIHILTHGTSHLIPLNLGQEHDHYSRYPALTFYLRAMQNKAPATRLNQVGVLVYKGDDTDRHISLVEAEAAVITDQSSAKNIRVDSPADYPRRVDRSTESGPELPHYDLVYIGCHGGIYTDHIKNVELSSLHIGQGKNITSHDIIGSAIRPTHIYAGACLIARMDEDITGSVVGMVISWFQNGTASVIGSVVSLPDKGACLLGILAHRYLIDNVHPIHALRQAQTELKVASENQRRGQPLWGTATQRYLAALESNTEYCNIVNRVENAYREKGLIGLKQGLGKKLSQIRSKQGVVGNNLDVLTPHLLDMIPVLQAMGLVDDQIDTLKAKLGGCSRLDEWMEQVNEQLPTLDLSQFHQPPPALELGALLYGMTGYGRAN